MKSVCEIFSLKLREWRLLKMCSLSKNEGLKQHYRASNYWGTNSNTRWTYLQEKKGQKVVTRLLHTRHRESIHKSLTALTSIGNGKAEQNAKKTSLFLHPYAFLNSQLSANKVIKSYRNTSVFHFVTAARTGPFKPATIVGRPCRHVRLFGRHLHTILCVQ